jgi:hypothetical protein
MDLIPVGGTTPLLTNDDWGTNANLPALRAAMPFPLVEGSKDAAALTTLSTATNTATPCGSCPAARPPPVSPWRRCTISMPPPRR